jgi:hypothetical protein
VRINFSGIIAICVLAVFARGAAADPSILEPYTWQNRLLLVFAPRADDPRLQRQNQLLDEVESDLVDRDLVVIRLAPDAPVTVDSVLAADASPADLYRAFGVAQDAFAVLLIGKDGGVKLSSAAPVDAASVFDLIDAMPMRQWEMQNKDVFDKQD